MPKLTHKHIFPGNKDKMNVKLVTQIFSNSVSSAIKFLVNDSKLDQKAISTATFLKLLNDIYDILNNKDSDNKKYLKEDSLAWKTLESFLIILDNIQFLTYSNQQKGHIVCLDNLKLTINSFMLLYKYLNKEKQIYYILTKKINQDPLENLFSILRNQVKESGTLKVETFEQAFTIVIHSSLFKRKLIIKNKNCLDDENNLAIFINTNAKLINKNNKSPEDNYYLNELDDEQFLFFDDILKLESLDENVMNLNIAKYVAGFILKKLSKLICKR